MHKPINSRNATSPGVQDNARFRSARGGAHDERGQALLEFAYLLPILMILLLGMIAFGITLNNYLEMTNGATAGAQALAISRGQTLDPCGTAAAPFYATTPNLTQSNLKFTITLSPGPGGSGSTYVLATNQTNPSCPAASTTSAPASDLIQGYTATVMVTYPCNLSVFGVNFVPPASCILTAQTAESVQ
jgi:Flp pilus assembly protein TadG